MSGDVGWLLPGSTPKESLDGVRKEPLVGEVVVAAHGSKEERGCGSTRRSMIKVADAICGLVRAQSSRSPT
jgi:hypothetical protein